MWRRPGVHRAGDNAHADVAGAVCPRQSLRGIATTVNDVDIGNGDLLRAVAPGNGQTESSPSYG